MPEALALVKGQLGPDAVILGTRVIPGGGVGGLLGRQRCEITATRASAAAPSAARPAPIPPIETRAPLAASESASRKSKPRTPSVTVSFADDTYTRLVQHEVSDDLARSLVERAMATTGPSAGPAARERALREEIARIIPKSDGIELSVGTPRKVALVGPAGGGKTTTLAKLAAHYALRLRKRVAILSLDMHRMATHEQVRRYGEIIRVPVHSAQSVAGVTAEIEKLREFDLVLIDTAGAAWTDENRIQKLGELLKAAAPDETHLVLPASLSHATQIRCAQAFRAIGASRVALTHVDEIVGLGVIFSAIEKVALPASYLSAGQVVPDDLEPACGQRLARLLLEDKSVARPRVSRGNPQGGGREIEQQVALS